jgi:hypothetical protein
MLILWSEGPICECTTIADFPAYYIRDVMEYLLSARARRKWLSVESPFLAASATPQSIVDTLARRARLRR